MEKTVLLVDYDPRSIDTIRRCLATLGVRTVLATDGHAGEREFHRTLPDLTLVQDVLPKRRGVDLCRALKSSTYGPEHSVVLIADGRNGGRHRIMASGCDGWLQKPFDDKALLSVVLRFLPDLIPFSSSTDTQLPGL